MRIMGIDYGTKRIGIAMSDELGMMAHASDSIERKAGDNVMETLKRLAGDNGVGEVVVGLPINMNGTFSEKTREVQAFVEELRSGIGLPVNTWDERLTSVMAERTLLEADMSRQKRRKLSDKLAAKFILQGYLDSKRR